VEPFARGDSSADGGVDITDPLFTTSWLFTAPAGDRLRRGELLA